MRVDPVQLFSDVREDGWVARLGAVARHIAGDSDQLPAFGLVPAHQGPTAVTLETKCNNTLLQSLLESLNWS